MKIVVDADACPVKDEVVREAKRRGLEVVNVADTAHAAAEGYARHVTVDRSGDSADFAIVRLLAKGDVVVTQDYGLAAMVLGMGAYAIHQSGMEYTPDNIDRLLVERHFAARMRRGGVRMRGPAKRTGEDNRRFAEAFTQLLDRVAGENP